MLFYSYSRKRFFLVLNLYKLRIIEIIRKEMLSVFCKVKLFLLNYWVIFFVCVFLNKLILFVRRKKKRWKCFKYIGYIKVRVCIIVL